MFNSRKFLPLYLTLLLALPLHANRENALADFENSIRTFAGPHQDYIDASVQAISNTDKEVDEITTYGEALAERSLTLFKNRRPISVKLMILALLNTDRSLDDIENLTAFNEKYSHVIGDIIGEIYYAMTFVCMIETGMNTDEMIDFIGHIDTPEFKERFTHALEKQSDSERLEAFERVKSLIKHTHTNSIEK